MNNTISQNCHINVAHFFIWANCSYPSNTLVTGFQVIAQLSDSSQIHKLFSSKIMYPQTSTAISVEETGLYQVTIIEIKQKLGIMDSRALKHVEQVLVMSSVPTVPSKYYTIANTFAIHMLQQIPVVQILQLQLLQTLY